MAQYVGHTYRSAEGMNFRYAQFGDTHKFYAQYGNRAFTFTKEMGPDVSVKECKQWRKEVYAKAEALFGITRSKK